MVNSERLAEVRGNVIKAFKDLRKQGLICRANFSCCSTCAGYDITVLAVDRINQGKCKKEDIKGCAFWHNQDEQRWKEYGIMDIRYGDMDSSEYGIIGIDTVEVGKMITEAFDKYDIPYDWDGRPSQTISISAERKENVDS